jgi:hypothetical protein
MLALASASFASCVSVDRDHRRAAGVDGFDDRGVVDALHMNRRDAELAVADFVTF